MRAVIFDFGHTLMDELAHRDVPLDMRPIGLMPEVLETLPRIKHPMGVWANTRVDGWENIWKWLRRAGIQQYFEWGVTSMEAGVRKPDARFFRFALEACGLKANDVIFVGNQLNTDIQGAVRSGIRCVWLAGEAYRSPDDDDAGETKPTYVIEHLSELPGLLEQIGTDAAVVGR